jgi:hypothetical protein
VNNDHLHFNNADLDYFLQYALACQTYQGSAYGECLYAASQIQEDDLESWVQAWTGVAQQVEAVGSTAEALGHSVSAREAYLRAATYRAVALVCVSPRNPRFSDLHAAFRGTFRRFAALLTGHPAGNRCDSVSGQVSSWLLLACQR